MKLRNVCLILSRLEIVNSQNILAERYGVGSPETVIRHEQNILNWSKIEGSASKRTYAIARRRRYAYIVEIGVKSRLNYFYFRRRILSNPQTFSVKP